MLRKVFKEFTASTIATKVAPGLWACPIQVYEDENTTEGTMQDYESTFKAILANSEAQPGSFGELGGGIKNAIAKRLLEQALAMVKAGIDEPAEREAIVDGAVAALGKAFPQASALLPMVSLLLTTALEAASSNLGG